MAFGRTFLFLRTFILGVFSSGWTFLHCWSWISNQVLDKSKMDFAYRDYDFEKAACFPQYSPAGRAAQWVN